MKIEMTVCDVCGDPDRGTTSYRVTSQGRGRTVDLCEEHAAPLEEILAAAANKPKRPRGARGVTATSMEEIAKKRKQKQKT